MLCKVLQIAIQCGELGMVAGVVTIVNQQGGVVAVPDKRRNKRSSCFEPELLFDHVKNAFNDKFSN
jgi:hypothetical protein